MTSPLIARLSALTALGVAAPAFGHGGHGLAGSSHWHATDTFGLLLVVAVAAAMAWLSRREK